jgi:hypothetical protein
MTKYLIELENLEFVNVPPEEQEEIVKGMFENSLSDFGVSLKIHNWEQIQEFLVDSAKGDITPIQGFMFRALSILAEINGKTLTEVYDHIKKEYPHAV